MLALTMNWQSFCPKVNNGLGLFCVQAKTHWMTLVVGKKFQMKTFLKTDVY